MVVQVMFVVITDPLAVFFLFSRFGTIGDYSLERILLAYALAITGFGLAELLCRGLDYFPWRMVRTGEFDRVLLRPAPLLLQVAGSYFHLHRISRVVGGLFGVFWSCARLSIPPTPSTVLLLFLAILGGFATYTGVFILTSGLAFFTIAGLDWIYIFTNTSYQVTRVPVEYMPRLLRNSFTFLLPILVITYYPIQAVLGLDSYAKGLLALPAGLFFLFFALQVWRFGVKHYASTGS